MSKIKILQAIGGLNRGGAETMLMNIYRIIDRNRFEFHFLIYVTDESVADYEDEIVNNGDAIIRLNRNRVKNPILFYKDINRIMSQEKYDCVHAHTLFNSGMIMYAAYKNNIPVRITHSHSSGNMKKDTFINSLYVKFSKHLIMKYSTNFIACDVNSGKYLFGEQFEGPVLHNGIDLKKFCFHENDNNNKYINLREDHVLNLAVIGSFYEVKNHKFLIPIAKKLKEDGVPFKMYFAGRGYLRDSLETMVKEYQLEKEVIFLGIVDQMEDFLKQIDIVLMPSLYEGIPVSLIEAQALGVQAIISNQISKDVDMGLGLLHFLPIDSDFGWMKVIESLKAVRDEKISADKIYKKLTDNGYNVEKNVDFICDIYSSGIN